MEAIELRWCRCKTYRFDIEWGPQRRVQRVSLRARHRLIKDQRVKCSLFRNLKSKTVSMILGIFFYIQTGNSNVINYIFSSSHVRSIDDISSGYSSTIDLSSRSELSRASSNASLRGNNKRSSRDIMSSSVSSTLPRRRASEKKQMRATK